VLHRNTQGLVSSVISITIEHRVQAHNDCENHDESFFFKENSKKNDGIFRQSLCKRQYTLPEVLELHGAARPPLLDRGHKLVHDGEEGLCQGGCRSGQASAEWYVRASTPSSRSLVFFVFPKHT
jgi:hypothetical protein